MSAGSSISESRASSAARSFVEPSVSWISTCRINVAARIASASRKGSGMRAVGGNGDDVRAAADVRNRAGGGRGGRTDGGVFERKAAPFADLAVHADATAWLFGDLLTHR